VRDVLDLLVELCVVEYDHGPTGVNYQVLASNKQLAFLLARWPEDLGHLGDDFGVFKA
jgi:hypothetical protein